MSSTPGSQPGANDESVDERNAQLEEERQHFIRELMNQIPEGYQLQLQPVQARFAALTTQKSTEYRGAYIGQTIQVEQQLNYILSMLFGGSVQQQQAFEHVVLERSPGINFSLKIDLMLEGLKVRCPEIYEQFATAGLFGELKEVRTRRNRLAHGGLDTSRDYIEERMRVSPGVIEEFRMVYWTKGEPKYETITVAQMQQHLFQVNRVTIGLVQVLNDVHTARKTYDEQMLETAFPDA